MTSSLEISLVPGHEKGAYAPFCMAIHSRSRSSPDNGAIDSKILILRRIMQLIEISINLDRDGGQMLIH
jgi:hypothetical protein